MKKFFIRLWHIIAAPYYWIQNMRFYRYLRKHVIIKESAANELTEKDEEVFNYFVEKYNIRK